MIRSSKATVGAMGLMGVLLAGLLAEEPAKKAEAVKPPWKRLLQGDDAKKAAEQEKKLAQLQEAGQFAEALRVAEALTELRSKKQGADHWQAVEARFIVEAIYCVLKVKKDEQQSYSRAFALKRDADALMAKGHYREEQPLLEQVLAIRRKVLGEEHPYTARGYNDVAYNLQAQGKYKEAGKSYGMALAIFRKVLGEDHPDTATSYDNLAYNQNAQGKYKEAGQGYGKALAIRRKVLGEEHPSTAGSYNNVAANLQAQGKYQEAEEGFGKALAIFRKLLGEEHLNTATSYNNLAYNQNAQGKYKQAEEGYRKSLAIRRKMLGEEHPDTATSLNNLAYNHYVQGKYKEAEEGFGKALAIRRKVLGEEHPDTATSYNSLAGILNAQGKYNEAEEGYGKALAIFRKVLGEDHPDTATSYNNLAANQNAQGKYKEAEEGYGKALAIRRKVLGEEHLDTAISYNNLALNLNAQGKFREAEEGLGKSLAICRKVVGERHPSIALIYNNVAVNLNLQGKHKEAGEIYGKALSIRRKVLGEEHPDTAISYNNLALNLNSQGKYQDAEEAYGNALAIFRKVLGEEHPLTATNYHNLAYNLQTQGKYQEAEKIYGKALAIYRKVLGEEHPDTIRTYASLAANLNAQGKHQRAEKACGKALATFRKVLGEEHPDTATSYGLMADNLNAQGKYQEAEEDYRKALAIHRKVLGEVHPYTAASYNNLAGNLKTQGKYEKAGEGYGKALAIFRQVLGEEHPNTATSYSNVAVNLYFQGKYTEAESVFLRAADSFAKARLYVAATGLDRAVFNSEHSPLSILAAVLARNGKPDDAWQRFEESLARGTLDDFTARLRRPQDERDKQAQITARIDRLQKLITSVSVAKPTSEQAKQRDELLTQLRQAYKELAAFTKQMEKKYGPIAGQVFAVDRIQKSLSADAAFLAWLDIAGQPKAADPNGEHWAILLRAAGAPVWVRLHGSGDKDAWTDADTKLPTRLRAALQSSDREEWQSLAERLRQQRLQPLAPYLKGVRRLIVLPSTALAGVPLEVIADGYTVSYAHSASMYAHLHNQPDPTGKGLLALADPIFQRTPPVEKPLPLPPHGVLLTMVLSGSNAFRAGLRANDVLLRYGDTELKAPTDFKPQTESNDPEKRVPVVFWRDGVERKRPIYVRPGKLGVVIAKEPAPQALAEQRRVDRLLASSRGDGDWKELPGTRLEAAALRSLFGDSARLLQKSEASEQRLNELAASGELGKYRYLHLATHGEVNNIFPLRSAVILARDHLPDDKQRVDLLTAGQSIPDGRLEADEALRRWHLHCDLVTLSACQTALGKYERGEGFVGFAQALVLCGTRSVCLSLWEANDLATALLMERFYQNLLGKRDGLKAPMSKADALADAKQWLRTLPRDEVVKRAASLTEGDSRGKGRPLQPVLTVKAKDDRPFAHPYYWAAFILSGHAD